MGSFLRALVLFFISLGISSQEIEYINSFRSPSFSDYGEVGLMALPTARMMPAGSLAFHWSRTQPYMRGSINATPFSWFEALFKYTDLNNQLYSGIKDFSGGQSLKDKGFDIKFVLLKESQHLPQIAFGMRDFAGSDLFGSEYLVFTKMVRNFDLSVGMGWGMLSGRNNFSNPLTRIAPRFEFRGNSGETGQSGNLTTDAWLAGKNVGLFGGFEYYPRFSSKLRFKAEYDSTNYNLEGGEFVPQSSQFNFGIVYNQSKTLNWHLGVIRGNTLQLGFTLKGSFADKDPYKLKRDPIKKINNADIIKRINTRNQNALYLSSLRHFNENEIFLQAMKRSDHEVHVAIQQTKHQNNIRAAGRAADILNQIMPDEITSFTVSSLNAGIPMHSITIPRDEYVANIESKYFEPVQYKSTIEKTSVDWKNFPFLPKAKFPFYNLGFTPAINSHIGGPDGFYFGELYLRSDFSLVFSRNISVSSTFSYSIWDDFDEIKLESDSVLPHVRTDIVKYLNESEGLTVTRMHLNITNQPFTDLYSNIQVGLLEDMFGGYGGEILYRPFKSSFAVGAELFKVKQRDYKQRFEFLDYETTTGFINFFYKHQPSGVLVSLKGGRFLAEDSGIHFDFSRRFRSGFYVGAFFVLTDISAEEYGEGSFTKGFYFSFPLEIFQSKYSKARSYFGLTPLTRDGGAPLVRSHTLFGITDQASFNNLENDWYGLYD